MSFFGLTFNERPNKRMKIGEDPTTPPTDGKNLLTDDENLFEKLPNEIVERIFVLICQTGSYITIEDKTNNGKLKLKNVLTTNVSNFQLICRRCSLIANGTFIQFARKEIDLKGVEDSEVSTRARSICISRIDLLAKSFKAKPTRLINLKIDSEKYNLCYLLMLNKSFNCADETLTCAGFNWEFPTSLQKIATEYLKEIDFNRLKMQWQSSSVRQIKETLNIDDSKDLVSDDFKKFINAPLNRSIWCSEQTLAYCYYELLLNQFYDFVPSMMESPHAILEIISRYDQEILFSIPEKWIKSIDWFKAPTCSTENGSYYNHLLQNSNTGVFSSVTGGFNAFNIDNMFKRICIQNIKSPKFARFIKSILTLHADKMTELLEPKEKEGVTPLHLLCFYSGNKEAAEELLTTYKVKFGEEALRKYIDKRAHKNMQYTPVHLAVMHAGNEEILKYLFSLGANPFLETKRMDALHLALLHKRASYVEMILSHDKFQVNKNKFYAGDGKQKDKLRPMFPLKIPHNYLDYAVLQWDMLELLQKHGISFLANETPANFLMKSVHFIKKGIKIYKIDDIVNYFKNVIPLLKMSFPNQGVPFLSTISQLDKVKSIEILLKLDKNHFSQENCPEEFLQHICLMNPSKESLKLSYNELIKVFLNSLYNASSRLFISK